METTDWLVLLAATSVIVWMAYKLHRFKKFAIDEFDEDVDTEIINIMHYRIGTKWPDCIRHLYHNRLDIEDLEDWVCDADHWQSCACGMLDPRIRRDINGVPLDKQLYDLGIKFNRIWDEVGEMYANGDIEQSEKQATAKEFAEELMQLCIDIDNRELEILSEVAPYNENFQ